MFADGFKKRWFNGMARAASRKGLAANAEAIRFLADEGLSAF